MLFGDMYRKWVSSVGIFSAVLAHRLLFSPKMDILFLSLSEGELEGPGWNTGCFVVMEAWGLILKSCWFCC